MATNPDIDKVVLLLDARITEAKAALAVLKQQKKDCQKLGESLREKELELEVLKEALKGLNDINV